MEIKKVSKRTGKGGIIDTMVIMKKMIIDSDLLDKERLIKETARSLIKDVKPTDYLEQVRRIFEYVRNNLKYVGDIYKVEEITYPFEILKSLKLKKENYSSDCDDFAVLLASLLRSIGFKTRLEVLALKSDKQYDHARVSVFIPSIKKWMPLEGTSKSLKLGEGFKSKLPILALEV